MRVFVPTAFRVVSVFCVVLLWFSGRANAAVFIYTAAGTYDDASNANAVDFNASGNALTSLNATDVAGFSANVAAAFLTGNGGVIQFDRATLSRDGIAPSNFNQVTTVQANNNTGPVPDTLSFSFNGGAKSIAVTSTSVLRVATYGSATALSGGDEFDIGNSALPTDGGASLDGQQSFSFNFGALTGGAANEAITALGFTALSRSGTPSTVGLTVTYSDNTTSAPLSRNLLGNQGAQDTFYGFIAPTGLSISSLNISRSARVPFDDLGFITSVVAVPEPSTFALLFVGGVMLTIIYRRKVNAICA